MTNADGTSADVCLPFGWEERRTPDDCPYVVNYRTHAPQYKLDSWRKIVYFPSWPAIRLIADVKSDVRVRCEWVFGDNFAAVDALDYGDVSHEWFFCSHEVSNPSYGPFKYSVHDNYARDQSCLWREIRSTSTISNPSAASSASLYVFRHRFLNTYIVSGIYKIVLNEEANLKDLKAVDF
ncbi:hypothetical protein BJY52DRAFT_1197333 [Lactarius psammicola]|nr:hypothetical protein BJY52DRAFT_1197333 [Lactarius psammicola]